VIFNVVAVGPPAGFVTDAVAGTAGGGGGGHAPMTWVGTVFSNVVYIPAKIVYAGLGAVTTGLAFVLTGADRSVSNRVWNSSVEGTYLVTPRMIEGKDRVRFVGP
jgi:hypothetical protein